MIFTLNNILTKIGKKLKLNSLNNLILKEKKFLMNKKNWVSIFKRVSHFDNKIIRLIRMGSIFLRFMIINKVNIVDKKMRNFKRNFSIQLYPNSISVKMNHINHLKVNGSNAIVIPDINKKLILLAKIKKKVWAQTHFTRNNFKKIVTAVLQNLNKHFLIILNMSLLINLQDFLTLMALR